MIPISGRIAVAVLRDQQAAHRLGAPGGVDIALAGRDDRALHQDVPGVRELLGVAQAGLARQPDDDRADVCQVLGAGSPAALVRSFISSSTLMNEQPSNSSREPLVEEVEDRQ